MSDSEEHYEELQNYYDKLEALMESHREELRPQRLNDYLKIIAPSLNAFDRNFCAYKLSEHLLKGMWRNEKVVIYEMDGDQWCAHYEDFLNLQESPAGFGHTQEEAKRELLASA